MECPTCHTTTHVEIDTHSDGYAKNLQECGECGSLWITQDDRQILVHDGLPQAVNQ